LRNGFRGAGCKEGNGKGKNILEGGKRLVFETDHGTIETKSADAVLKITTLDWGGVRRNAIFLGVGEERTTKEKKDRGGLVTIQSHLKRGRIGLRRTIYTEERDRESGEER